MTEHHAHAHAPTIFSYAVGYFLSLACTLLAFGAAYMQTQPDHASMMSQPIYFGVAVLALIQLLLQSIFFLHVSKKASHNFLAFIFTMYTVTFIVIGSLWIMRNLQVNMTSTEMSGYMHMQN